MHRFTWPVQGMVDSRIFVEKNELSDPMSGGFGVLLCVRLFADIASLVPHVAIHMNWWQITSENVMRRWSTRFVHPVCKVFLESW